jgi:hypothetical protein
VSLDVELPLAAVARRPKRMDHASGEGKCRDFECWSGAWDVRGQGAPGRDLTPIRVAVAAMGFRPVGAASSRVVSTSTRVSRKQKEVV